MSDTDPNEEPTASDSGDPDDVAEPDEIEDPDDVAEPEAAAVPRLTRRGRVRKWDRAPQPHDWRWYVGNVGKVLITTGILMFAFVGYQLYGTGIENAADQNRLEDEFEKQLAQFDAPEPGADTTTDGSGDTDEPDDGVVDGSGDVDQSGDVDGDVDQPDDADGADDPSDDPVVEPDPPTSDDESDEPTTEPVVEVVPVEQQNIPDIEDGDAIARLEIPAIETDDIVVAGVGKNDLKQGPGHFPDTPMPGQLGNTAIAGHRTTFGQPFRNVDQLVIGDEIRVTTANGTFVYLVTDQQIVSPANYEVIATSDPTMATITLVSCHPVFTARERIIIFGELDATQSSPVGAPVINYGRDFVPSEPEELPTEDVDVPVDSTDAPDETTPTTTDVADTTPDPADDQTDEQPVPDSPTDDPPATNDTDQLGSDQVNASIADAFSEGWFSDPAANPQVGLWGLVLSLIAIAAYAISRRFRRDLLGLAIGLVPFVVALYFFFQNVNRLLPPNL